MKFFPPWQPLVSVTLLGWYVANGGLPICPVLTTLQPTRHVPLSTRLLPETSHWLKAPAVNERLGEA
jgi:hypothetical protein